MERNEKVAILTVLYFSVGWKQCSVDASYQVNRAAWGAEKKNNTNSHFLAQELKAKY